MHTKLKFIRNVIYKLERSYGTPVDYHIVDQHTTDPETGVKTNVLQVIKINKAAVLRAREYRSFVYDLAYISANKDFTAGAFFDPEDRRIIIRASHLNGHVPQIDDYLIINNFLYTVTEVFNYSGDYAYELVTKKLKGSIIVRIVTGLNVLDFQHTATSLIKGLLDRDVSSELVLTQDLKEVP